MEKLKSNKMKDKIEQLLKELSDFSDAKVGDKVFSFFEGESEIKGVFGVDYPIKIKESWYTLNGKYTTGNKFPMLFKRNPYEAIAELFSNNNGFEERWMMVSNDNNDWRKRKVFMVKNNLYLAWDIAETDEQVDRTCIVSNWDYAKEIEEEKDVELTLEEIAEKFNINVKNLKIKK